jgi:cytochrome c biogenesis protein CcdA
MKQEGTGKSSRDRQIKLREIYMLETFFVTVNEWIAGGATIAALGCFLWGMISVVFSPCHLASIPLIVAYVGGQKQIRNLRRLAFTLLPSPLDSSLP